MKTPATSSGGFKARSLRFGSNPLLAVEGEVVEAQRLQQSQVHSRRHLTGAWSIGTTIRDQVELWLRQDDGQEVSLKGTGELQLRPGHRVRILARGERTDLRVVALRNLSTSIDQWDEVEAAAARESTLSSLAQIGLALVLVILLLLGLLLWALSSRSGAHYLLPALVPFGLGMALHIQRRDRFRRFAEAAMQ